MCIAILKAPVFPDFESVLQNMRFRGGFFFKGKVTQWVTEVVNKAWFLEDGRNCLD